MGLIDCKCDSCGDKVDVLFPVAILDELPTGGEAMVIKYYCFTCRESVEDEAQSTEPDNNEKDISSCGRCKTRAQCISFNECRKEHADDEDLPHI